MIVIRLAQGGTVRRTLTDIWKDFRFNYLRKLDRQHRNEVRQNDTKKVVSLFQKPLSHPVAVEIRTTTGIWLTIKLRTGISVKSDLNAGSLVHEGAISVRGFEHGHFLEINPSSGKITVYTHLNQGFPAEPITDKWVQYNWKRRETFSIERALKAHLL